MGNIGLWQILLVAVLVVLLFGRGKISELMGDVAKGIKSFQKGLKDEDSKSENAAINKSSEEPAPGAKSAQRDGAAKG